MQNALKASPWFLVRILFLSLLSCPRLLAQSPELHGRAGFPTVTFTFVSWNADPPYYSIAIDSSGTATYSSSPNLVTQTGVPYTLRFNVSDRTRRITFNLARELGFFSDPSRTVIDSPQNAVVRTLTYNDLQFHNQMTYSSTSDSDVEELTSVFEEISETLEFGRRLDYFYQHDKSTLNRELDDLQKNVAERKVRELEAITPILERITSDQNLEAGIRHKAETLLNAASHL